MKWNIGLAGSYEFFAHGDTQSPLCLSLFNYYASLIFDREYGGSACSSLHYYLRDDRLGKLN